MKDLFGRRDRRLAVMGLVVSLLGVVWTTPALAEDPAVCTSRHPCSAQCGANPGSVDDCPAQDGCHPVQAVWTCWGTEECSGSTPNELSCGYAPGDP